MQPKKKFVELPKGHTTYLTSDTTYEEFVTEDMIYVDYENIEEVVTPGDLIAFDNGSVTLMVKDIRKYQYMLPIWYLRETYAVAC